MSDKRKIKGYDHYWITESGRVWSSFIREGKGRWIKASTNSKGYLYVYLSKHGKVKALRVNRLVALEFIDNPNNLPQVNHLDQNKLNNEKSNLVWCTNSENKQHSAKLNWVKVRVIRKLIGDMSNVDVGKIFNITPQMVGKIYANKTWKK